MIPKSLGKFKIRVALFFTVFFVPAFILSWHFFLGNIVKNFTYSLNPDNLKITVSIETGTNNKKEITTYVTKNKDKDKDAYNLDISAESADLQIQGMVEKPKAITLSVKEPNNQDTQIKTDIVYVSGSPAFGKATITLKKSSQDKINAILYCPDQAYDKEGATCQNWEITDIIPQVYPTQITFEATHFSAYAGAYLEIINVQSNLTKGYDWITYFKVYGQADLTIEAVNGTIWGRDIGLKGFYCGDQKIDVQVSDNKLFIKDYFCEQQISRIENIALTSGKHTLKFAFGDNIYYARNFACDSGSLINPGDICYISTTQYFQSNDYIYGTGTLMIISGGNLAPTSTNATATISIIVTEDIIINATGSSAGTITVNFQSTSTNLTVANSSSSVNVNAKGYPGVSNAAGSGPGGGAKATGDGSGNPAYAGGGGHGGSGGTGSVAGGTANGSTTQPRNLGSAGGGAYPSYANCLSGSTAGGNGGGFININVSGTTTINGAIYANGSAGNTVTGYLLTGCTIASYGYTGGGAGGSIYITTNNLTGSGSIVANGGASSGGGGSGGRITIYYNSNNYSGSETTYGGTGYSTEGAAGTIYIKDNAQDYGDLTVNNNNQSGAGTQVLENNFIVKNLTIGSGANFQVNSGLTFNLASTSLVTSAAGTITNNGIFNATSALSYIGGAIVNNAGGTFNFNNLTSASGTITNSGTLSFDNLTSATGTITNSGTLNFGGFNSAALNFDLTNSGTTTFSSLPSTVTFNGNISNTGNLLMPNITDLTIAASKTFTVNTISTTTQVKTYLPNLANLTINGTLSHQANTTSKVNYIDLTLQNLTINSGGSVNVNSKGLTGGYSTANGNISGQGGGGGGLSQVSYGAATLYAGGGGGGHGGSGGAGYVYNSGGSGGISNGSSTAPTNLGSGGGGAYSDNYTYDPGAEEVTGGIGGGAVKLTVSGILTHNGTIIANGGSGTASAGTYQTAYGGGGSGGSIWITAATTTGNGTTTANGGSTGGSYAGGGSGGRIAILTNNNGLSGTMTVSGTTGHTKGATGTLIYDYDLPESSVNLICNNNSCTLSGQSYEPQETFRVTTITGTSSDINGISAVDISVRASSSDATNGKYYNTSTNAFDSDSELWVRVTGTSTWSYDASNIQNGNKWVIGSYYIIRSRATDSPFYRVEEEPMGSITFKFVNSPPQVNYLASYPGGTGYQKNYLEDNSQKVILQYSATDTEECGPTGDGSTTWAVLFYKAGATTSAQVASGAATIDVTNSSYMPASGTLMIDDELINYTSNSGNVISGLTRAASNTVAIAHNENSEIWIKAQTAEGLGIICGQTYTVSWNATSDVNYYSANQELKIVVNDGSSNSMIGSTTSAPFTFDTIYPQRGATPITIDSTSTLSAYIQFFATENSTSFMKVATTSDLSGISWTPFSATTTMVLVNTPTTTVYYQYRDYFNNTSQIFSEETPSRPINTMIQDTSNVMVDPKQYRLFLAWEEIATPTSATFTEYIVYKSNSSGGPYSVLTTISQKSQNYYADNNPTQCTSSEPATYSYYQIASKDAHNNISFLSGVLWACADGTQNAGEGGGGGTPGDTTPPAISNVATSSLSMSGITITWNTDELSDSWVDYGTSTAYGHASGDLFTTTTHQVALSGLSASTTYHFRVRSSDRYGNISTTTDYIFSTTQDTTPPVITCISVTVSSATSVNITWETDKDADSQVEYGTGTPYTSSTTLDTTQTKIHSVTLENLISQQIYYFQAISKDIYQNTVTSTSTFTTLDNIAPQITNIASTTYYSTATIAWSTDESADSWVDYGTTTSYGYTAGSLNNETSHSVMLSGLSLNTTYHFRVLSRDQLGNTATSSDYTFKTIADNTPPVISSVSAIATDLHSATIIWNTDERSSSQVIYSTFPDMSSPSNTATVNDLRMSHSVLVSGLEINTTYYYYVSSADQYYNYQISATGTFTTANANEDMTAPVITAGPSYIGGLSTTTIEWTTDENSNSIVDYGTSWSFGSMAGNVSASTQNHSVLLQNLSASTTYYYQVRSQDSSGNTVVSASSSFTTIPDTTPPAISNVSTSTVSSESATVIWDTDTLSDSRVDYGTVPDTYTASTTNINLTIQHSGLLNSLSASTTYYYRVYSKDAAGNQATSSEYQFTTPGVMIITNTVYVSGGGGMSFGDRVPPAISFVEVIDISENSAKIKWVTDESATAKLKYGPTNFFGRYEYEAEDSGVSYVHQISIENLLPGTEYHFQAISQDTFQNTSKTDDATFITLGESMFPEQATTTPASTTKTVPPSQEESTVLKIFSGITDKIISVFKINPELTERSFISMVVELASKIVSPPIITGDSPKIETGPTWAKINWNTDKEANSMVAFAKYSEYDLSKSNPYPLEVGNSQEFTVSHSVTISGLEAATLYHFQIRSKPQVGPLTKSQDGAFKTSSQLPEISNISFEQTTEYQTTLAWQTNIPTQSFIECINEKTGENKQDSDEQYLRSHSLTIKDLQADIGYSLSIKAADESGNTALSPKLTFSTGQDDTPPQIYQVRTDTAISAKGDKVQAIISWLTNEPSDSQVFYQQGVKYDENLIKSTPADKTLTKKHVVVISSFDPAVVYLFRVRSEDSSGNNTTSQDFTLLTPQQRKSVLQIMIENFQKTFGWMENVGF